VDANDRLMMVVVMMNNGRVPMGLGGGGDKDGTT
jgi:hypothetical protein